MRASGQSYIVWPRSQQVIRGASASVKHPSKFGEIVLWLPGPPHTTHMKEPVVAVDGVEDTGAVHNQSSWASV